MSLLDSVDRTLDALQLNGDRDAAAAELARTYARQIDGARATAARADKALREVTGRGDDVLVELVEALRSRLSELTAVDKIGGRLGPLLAELGATPKSRGAAASAPPASGEAGPSPLGKLRSA